MVGTATAEVRMGRKKKGPASEMITVKIKRSIHTKLGIIASVEHRDISDLLSEVSEAPVDRRYKIALAKLNEAEGGK